MQLIGSVIVIEGRLVFVPDNEDESPFFLDQIIMGKLRNHFIGWDGEQIDNCILDISDASERDFRVLFNYLNEDCKSPKREIKEILHFEYHSPEGQIIDILGRDFDEAIKLSALIHGSMIMFISSVACGTAKIYLITGNQRRLICPEKPIASH